jgi:CDP-diacylglycerol---serine O-phosphatidyltransferase
MAFLSFEDPDEPPPRRRRVRELAEVPARRILPNLVTLLALCAGLTSIRMSIEQRFDAAVAAIAIAALLDGIDGRVARFLRSSSRFGAELDSLTDFLNFGVAPGILLFVWTLDEVHSLGWMVVLVFAICAALRLARFNVALDDPKRPEWQGNYFVGVPAPAGAIVVLLPVYMEFVVGTPHGFWTAPLVLVYTLAIALLMVSRLPTWSGKLIGRRIPRDMVLPIFVIGVVAVALLVSYPWQTATVATLAYLASLPFSWSAFHRRSKADSSKAVGESGGVERPASGGSP